MAALLVGVGHADAATVAKPRPALLGTLQAELSRFRYCADEASAEGDDWWGFWWSLPERGCGDCEDFAAYSHARLRQLGVPPGDLRLMAAEVGEQRTGNGRPAALVHLWLEVDLDGSTWTVWNRQIRAGIWRQGRRMLSRTEVDDLVDRSFGPNWPYGIDLP
jgi:Bacterial transglutaminase-like cysteine proteinase BTLCP